MSESRFRKISRISESFCDKCFRYEKDEEAICSDLDKIVKIIKSGNDDVKELLLVFAEKGARTAFLNHALQKTQTGQKATDGITTDNEFQIFLKHLKEKIIDSPDINIITEVFNHLLFEVESVSAEINVTSLQSFNLVDATYNEKVDGINNRTSTMKGALDELQEKHKKHIEDFEDKIHGVERKMHESNITILGVFSAVVLVFNAAVSFYSSAINAFSHSNSYKIIAILLIIGIILTGTLMGLFYYLDRVRKSANSDVDKYTQKIIEDEQLLSLNNNVEADSAQKTIYILDKTEGKTSVLGSLLPFIITLFLLVVGLLLVFGLWKNGSIEVRNQDVKEQIASSIERTEGMSSDLL